MRLSLLAGLSLVCAVVLSTSIKAEPAVPEPPFKIILAEYSVLDKFYSDIYKYFSKPEYVLPVDPWKWVTTDLWGAGRGHRGIDLALKTGENAYSMHDGVVLFSGWSGPYGRLVVVGFGNVELWYGHLSKTLVSVGDKVSAGQVVGLIGNSGYSFGPHLHLGLKIDGNFVDPSPWIKSVIVDREWSRTYLYDVE